MDLILSGEKGLIGIEVKRAGAIRNHDIKGLRAFVQVYPMARAYVFYGGPDHRHLPGIELIPLDQALPALPGMLSQSGAE